MKDFEDKYRFRVHSCIKTIIDVHDAMKVDYQSEEFLSQFEKLKEAFDNLDISLVCENDILMVEQATNALLKEFNGIFESGKLGPVYKELKS